MEIVLGIFIIIIVAAGLFSVLDSDNDLSGGFFFLILISLAMYLFK